MHSNNECLLVNDIKVEFEQKRNSKNNPNNFNEL